MKRINFSFTFIFDPQNKMFLQPSAELDGQPVSLVLSELMRFLCGKAYQLEEADSEFCFALAKIVKKVQQSDNFFLAIPSDEDMAFFFKKAKSYNIELTWINNNEKTPLKYQNNLPLTVIITKSNNNQIACTLKERDEFTSNPLYWLPFSYENERYLFSNGIMIKDFPTACEDFLLQFLDKQQIIYQNQNVIFFIKQIYSLHKTLINWDIYADFSEFLPKEVTPLPLLKIDYSQGQLKPILFFQYGNEVIEPNYTEETIREKSSDKTYSRMMDMEAIYQQDLMSLFTENNLPFLLENPGDIAKFMGNVVPILSDRDWIIDSNAPEFKVIKEPVTLNIPIQSDGTDWFHFEPNCTVNGQKFSLTEMAALMVRNQGYIKTKTGYVKVTEKSKKEIESLAKLGAFRIGKKFDRREILPMIAAANISGSDENSRNLVSKTKNFCQVCHVDPDETFTGKLREYQQYGVNWINFLYQNGLGGVLADDMGLGKTVQVIAFTSQIEKNKPALVVGPTNVVYNWEKEMEKFWPAAKVVVYSGSNRTKQLKQIPTADIVITSFGIIKNDIDLLQQIPFSCIYVDEAQYIKNPKTQISKAMKSLKGQFKLAMTGTPVENHLQDLWNLFDFIMPDYLGAKRKFEVDIADGNLDTLKTKIKPFLLRREKKEVLTELPDKTEIILKCPLSEPQEKLYQTVLDAARKGIKDSQGKTQRLNILTSLLKLRQVCIHPGLLSEIQHQDIESAKFELAKEKIIELVDENHKITLFTQFTGMINILEKWANEYGIYNERIDGSVTGKKRMEAIDRFQDSETPGIMIISLKAGGVGINLTAADYVIHLDPWWNPALEAQATDRVHRMGQKNKVIVYKIITEGTIEEKILDLQNQKKSLLAEIVDIDSVVDKKIDMDELTQLLF
jgi:superfamily II DNA or RNA helicase